MTSRYRTVLLAASLAAWCSGAGAASASAAPSVQLTPLCGANSLQSLTWYYGFGVTYDGFSGVPKVIRATVQREGRPAETVDVVEQGFRGEDGFRRLEPGIDVAFVSAFDDLDGNGAQGADEPEAQGTIVKPCAGARVDLKGGAARYFDYDAGVSNDLVVTGGGATLRFQDAARTLRPGASCEGGGSDATCSTSLPEHANAAPAGGPILSLDVRTGDGNDAATLAPTTPALPASVAGGRGSDSLTGGPGADTLIGAEDDPGAGEIGDDPLDGPDSLDGQGANDVLIGGFGDDRLTGGQGDDRLEGDAGADQLVGGDGTDGLSGGSGDDRIDSRDGNTDTVLCGPGRDIVVADMSDQIAAGDCEQVDRGTAAPVAPAVVPLLPEGGATAGAVAGTTQTGGGAVTRVPTRTVKARGGVAAVRITCLTAGIARLTLKSSGRVRVGGRLRVLVLGTRTFSCGVGAKTVAVKLRPVARRLLNRLGSVRFEAQAAGRDGARVATAGTFRLRA